jgi:hypothetical protein
MTTLYIVGVVLIEWLLVVAEITDQFQYYFWAFLVVVLWSEAINHRDPTLYPNRITRILYFSMVLIMFIVVNKSILYVQEVGLPLPGATPGAQ